MVVTVIMVMVMGILMVMVSALQIQSKQMKYGCRGSRLGRLISKCKISNMQSAVGFDISSIVIGHRNHEIKLAET